MSVGLDDINDLVNTLYISVLEYFYKKVKYQITTFKRLHHETAH